MSHQSIIIIGAGIAGLSSGCYAQMNGYKSRIFELHTQPGGLCTSWKRKGYTIDGCIHWMNGTAPASSLHHYWLELGALQGKTIVDQDEFYRVINPDGKTFILYTNIDRLEKHMKELSPSDSAVIEELAQDMRRFCKMKMPEEKPAELANVFDTIKMLPAILPYVGLLRKYQNMTVQQFAEKFKDPFLRHVFPALFDMPDFPMFGFIFTMTDMHKKCAGYPLGGSLELARAIERRYIDLGGEINYNTRVDKILVENNKAVGIRLADGSEQRADVVISAADGHATIFDMLDGKYIDDEIRGYYRDLPIFEPIIQVSLGVARDLSNEPHAILKKLEKPIEIAGEKRNHINFKHYAYDATLAPAGRTVITSMISSNHQYWKKLRDEDNERYEAEKKEIALQVMAQLEQHFPGIGKDIEMSDVATPLTYERYTGNWQGSYEGWLVTTKTMKMMTGKGMRKTLPGLDNFYMVGQWVSPGGGLPSGLLTGRSTIQVICHRHNRQFKTLLPAV